MSDDLNRSIPDDENQESCGMDYQRLCDAASALFFTLARHQFHRTGNPIQIPILLCPTSDSCCICNFTSNELDEAEAFLARLGMIRKQDQDPDEMNTVEI